MNRTTAFGATLLATAAKALLLALLISAPLLAAGAVRAQSERILVGADRGNAGAGFVILVSLQRNA